MRTPIYEFQENTIEIDRQFSEYLDGKSVAIVGRSCLHDLEQGEFIDSHDVVVRIHVAVPYTPTTRTDLDGYELKMSQKQADYNDPLKVGQFVPEDWHSRVGRRVNILYHQLRVNKHEDMRRWLEIFERAGGKFLVSDITTNPDLWVMGYSYIWTRYARCVSWALKHTIEAEMHSKITTAPIVIADILRHNIKSAYITGCPCKYDRLICADLMHAKVTPRVADLKFIRRLCQDDRVSVDKHMETIFSEVE